MRFGFIYLWHDTKRNKFYLGSHLGSLDDGYTGSNRRFQTAYKSRPETFKRRILESFQNITSKELLEKEQSWLNLIKPEELFNKYYNEKNVAAGGDIVSNLSQEKKQEHAKKSGLASRKYWDNITPEDYEKRRKTAFGGNQFSREYMIQRNKELCSKTALITFPNGKQEIVTNIAEFCEKHNLNYGNMKTVLRGNGRRKSCKKYTGHYL